MTILDGNSSSALLTIEAKNQKILKRILKGDEDN
jgi:hypothetical protein